MPHVLQCEVFVEMLNGCFVWIAETEFLGFNDVWINAQLLANAMYSASGLHFCSDVRNETIVACANVVCEWFFIASRMLLCTVS